MKQHGDVLWYLPNKKKPFTDSTMATSDYIELLARKYDTVRDCREAIVFDTDAEVILQKYIDAGYGDRNLYDLLCKGQKKK